MCYNNYIKGGEYMAWETVLLIISSILFGGIYIFLIFCWFGKGTLLLRQIYYQCSNFTEDNKAEQRLVGRAYTILNLVIVLIMHAGCLCICFHQLIASIVIFPFIFISWGVGELILRNNKKFRQAREEISDSKKWQLYLESLIEKNNQAKQEQQIADTDIQKE